MVALILFIIFFLVAPAVFFAKLAKEYEENRIINIINVVGFVLLAIFMFNFYSSYEKGWGKGEVKYGVIENPYSTSEQP